MTILISDLEVNTSLEAAAMDALTGGCCYHFCRPVCCAPRPWWGGCYSPYFKVRRFKIRGLRLRGGMRAKV